MKFCKLTKPFLTLVACFLLLPMHAQVTIGNSEAPIDGALLQIKDTENVLGKAENATRGVAFPRVPLSQKNRLYPMFGKIGTEKPEYTSDMAAINAKHAGLVVYNTYTSASSVVDPNFIFQEGLYVWLGDKWASVGTPSVENGLNLTNAGVVRLGGKLTDSTSVELNGKPLMFDTGGKPFYIKDMKEIQTNAQQLVVDKSGQIGKANVTPTKLTFIQAAEVEIKLNPSLGQSGTVTEGGLAANITNATTNRVPGKNGTSSTSHPLFEKNLNWGKKVVVPFREEDIVTDIDVTIPVYEDAFNTSDFEYTSAANKIVAFELFDSLTVELTGYVNYVPAGNNTSGHEVLLNLTVQVKRWKYDSSGNPTVLGDWEDYSSVRHIMVDPAGWYRNTINLPPAVFEGKKGEQIRMIIVRPFDVSPTNVVTFLGGAHGLNNSFKTVTIANPWGTKFSSGIKITAIG